VARKKRRVCTLDAETEPFKYGRVPKPFTWGFLDGDHYADFWGEDCTDQLIDYLSTEENLLVYAHNGGKFDFHYLLPYLDQDLLIINGRIAKATMFNGAIELRDSWLILPLGLAQMQKDVIDYSWFEVENREKHKPDILKYQKSDCEYLYNYVTAFRKSYGNGLTLAGSAFKQLKKTGYEVGKTYVNYDDRFRPYYYGGRVQCFKTGTFEGDHLYIDINSAYPYAMKDKHWQGSQYIEHLRLPEKSKNGSWFASIDAVSDGALPYRGEDGRLYFPTDKKVRTYHVTGWEINAGLDTNTLEIKKVHKSYRPLFTEDFSAYVDKFFELRKEAKAAGDKTADLFAKLMLNSAYGKFGQDGRKFEKFCIEDFGNWPEGEGWEPYADTPTGQMLFSKPDPQDSFFNVSTAASITGYVRAYLWRAICDSDDPLYCDTDSIICRDFKGEVGKELGQWDIEARPVEVHIAQRKMYAMKMGDGETKTASKGVRLSFDEIKSGVVSGKNITTKRDAPAFSLKYGPRFTERETDFKNIAKNMLTEPS